MIIDYVTSNSLKYTVGKRTLEEYQKKGLFHDLVLNQTTLILDEIQVWMSVKLQWLQQDKPITF